METQTVNFIRNQFKAAGLNDAFTPSLEEKLNSGNLEIKHGFTKKYDGDEVNGTIYLKKSQSSDAYFLNRFDLELTKEGQTTSVKQAFPIYKTKENDGEGNEKESVRFTLKKAYNFLAGRPVFNTYMNKEEQPYKVWEKIDLTATKENGSYESKRYGEKYGFNLEEVLKNYSIKELATEKYKHDLIDSLQRGNLQKVSFVDNDGRETKLFISPNVTAGKLDVYDENKVKLSMDKLLEQGYLGKDFADQLKKNYAEKHEAPKQNTAKQDTAPQGQKQEGEKATATGDEKKNLSQKEKPPRQRRTTKQSIK